MTLPVEDIHDDLVVVSQSNTSRPVCGRLAASTVDIVRDSLRRLPRRPATPWTASHETLNDRRRHMGKSALAAVAAELEPHFAADANRRQARKPRAEFVPAKLPEQKRGIEARQEAAKQAKRNQPQAQKVEKLPPIEKSKAREEAAKSVGVNDRAPQNRRGSRGQGGALLAVSRRHHAEREDGARKAVAGHVGGPGGRDATATPAGSARAAGGLAGRRMGPLGAGRVQGRIEGGAERPSHPARRPDRPTRLATR